MIGKVPIGLVGHARPGVSALRGKVALVGPTAAGKTAVGILLARRFGGEIISADSVQVYRKLDIGTAKPTAEERAQATFHLVDVADPDQEWTLSDVQEAESTAQADIVGRGHLPLIVGGTGLYVRAMTTQLDLPTVPPNEEFRERWRKLAEEHGNEYVHAELAKIDPEAAARIHVNDTKRAIRALEVFEGTGKTLSALHAKNREEATSAPTLNVGLNYDDRRILYTRIEQRVDVMMSEGLEDEVRGLVDAGYGSELKSMQSLGYRHMCEYLAGNMSMVDAVDLLKRDTRHFARRQLIWFRGDDRVQWVSMDGKSYDQIADEVAPMIERFLTGDDTGSSDRIA